MKNVYIYCEGQTEEAFTNEILSPFFIHLDIIVIPIICTTKRTRYQKYKGGISDYHKIKKELTLLCKQHNNEYITTMIDYYGLPKDTPGIDILDQDIYSRITRIEAMINDDIGFRNLDFNLVLHEFEGVLFSDPNVFELVTSSEVVESIKQIRGKVSSPEHINTSPENAPSKQLESLIPNYSKVINGTILAKEIGIDKIMLECKHFSDWIEKIKNF